MGIGDGLVNGIIGLSDPTGASEAPRHGCGGGCIGEVLIYIVLPEFKEARSEGSSVNMTGTPLEQDLEAATRGDGGCFSLVNLREVLGVPATPEGTTFLILELFESSFSIKCSA